MERIQVDAVLLRGLMPELRLAPGMTLAGRILERHGGHGLLNLAGAVLVAELPPELEAGARLRLAVGEVRDGKVLLQVVPEAPPGAAAAPAPPPGPPPAAVPLPLPGGAHARVSVARREEGQGGAGGDPDDAGTRSVTLVYESPSLGRLELGLSLGPAGLVAAVRAPAGPSHELASANAGELRAALGRALGRPVDVHVSARRDRVDLRA